MLRDLHRTMTHQERLQVPQRIYDAIGAGWMIADSVAALARVDLSCAQKHLKRLADRGLLDRTKVQTRPRVKHKFAYRRRTQEQPR